MNAHQLFRELKIETRWFPSGDSYQDREGEVKAYKPAFWIGRLAKRDGASCKPDCISYESGECGPLSWRGRAIQSSKGHSSRGTKHGTVL